MSWCNQCDGGNGHTANCPTLGLRFEEPKPAPPEVPEPDWEAMVAKEKNGYDEVPAPDAPPCSHCGATDTYRDFDSDVWCRQCKKMTASTLPPIELYVAPMPDEVWVKQNEFNVRKLVPEGTPEAVRYVRAREGGR